MSPCLEPRRLEFDEAGRPYSRQYGDTYSSRDGALGQARHVFLRGSDLPQRWAGRRQFVILETGFGLGTNFLASWQAWREDPHRPQRLHFVSVEKHPLRVEDLRSPFPAAQSAGAAAQPVDPRSDLPPDALQDLRSRLAAQWPLPLPGLHRLEFEEGAVVLTLALGDALDIAPQLAVGVDAFFLDGFAPDRNPAMWDARLVRALARMARAGATAATYTCARSVRDALTANGFEVLLRPGFGSKRQMLTAQFLPRWKIRRHDPPLAYAGERQAIVVGGGLAGCASAYALRRRGWRVTLLERGGAIAPGASALPGGLLYPLLSADDNLASRLVRAGFLHSLALLQRQEEAIAAAGEARMWARCGVFHQANDAQHARKLRAQLQRDAWPEDFAVFLDADEAGTRLGMAPCLGGVWYARGAVVAASRWCRAMIGPARSLAGGVSPPLVPVLDFDVVRVAPLAAGWRVENGDGQCHEARVLVLANAIGMVPLLGLRHAPMHEIGGRISLLRAPALEQLRAGVSGDGYLVPPLLGDAAVGASYELLAPGALPVAEREADSEAQGANLLRMARMLANAPSVQCQGVFSGRRCVSRDRLPLAGALVDEVRVLEAADRFRGAHLPDLPRLPGLYCLAALGSRGLALAPLLGDHLASLIDGEPLTIEAALAAAIDPGRFFLRELR